MVWAARSPISFGHSVDDHQNAGARIGMGAATKHADDGAVDRGVNLALVGGIPIAFGDGGVHQEFARRHHQLIGGLPVIHQSS